MPCSTPVTTFATFLVTFAATFFTVIGSASAGTASGIAVDESGRPLRGVHIEVVYQTYRPDQIGHHGASVKKTAVTGPDGRYRIDMNSLPPGEYIAHAYQVVSNGGRATNVDLLPDDAKPFASNQNVVRNFTAGLIEMSKEHPYGNAGIFVLQNAVMDYTDLAGAEVTLTNVATKRTFVKIVRSSGEGLVVTGIPFGTYRCSVSLRGKPMQIALAGKEDTFSGSVVHDFTMGYTGNQIRVVVKP